MWSNKLKITGFYQVLDLDRCGSCISSMSCFTCTIAQCSDLRDIKIQTFLVTYHKWTVAVSCCIPSLTLRLPGSPKSELQERWPKKFRKKLCYFRLLPNLAHRKLIDLANHLLSSSPCRLLTVTHRVFENFEFYGGSRGIFVSRFCE